MLRKILLFLLIVGLLLCLGLAGFLTWGYYYVNRDLPKLSSIEDYRPPAVSRVFANDGTLTAEFYRERRYPVKLKDVPLVVRNAFLASEDANFYTHGGIDPVSIIRAFVKNVESGSMSQGGSTITQQVVKNLLLTPEKKLMRKLKEALLSWQIEKRFSKDEIFEMYLNQIFFGNFAYGIKAAGKLYFGKELKDLTISEATMLAGLPKAPSKFSPFLNPTRARRRQKYVLGQMVKAGFITEQQAKEARDRAVIYTRQADVDAERVKTQDQILKDLKAKREALRVIYEKDKENRGTTVFTDDGTRDVVTSIRERLRKSGR